MRHDWGHRLDNHKVLDDENRRHCMQTCQGNQMFHCRLRLLPERPELFRRAELLG